MFYVRNDSLQIRNEIINAFTYRKRFIMKIQKSNDITIWQSPNRREQPDKAYDFSCKYHIPSGDTKQL